MRGSAVPIPLDYFDFELEIGPGQGRDYPLAVVRSPAGEAREVLHFPYDSLALDNRLQALEIALLRSGGQRRRLPSPDEQTVQEFGSALFGALLTGDVRSRYDIARREAAASGKGLRIKLRIEPPELAALPWEFLYDPRIGEFICLSRTTPIVRYPVIPSSTPPLPVTPPLRVLGMIVTPRNLPPLDVQRERQRIEVAVRQLQDRGRLELSWLESQTWRELQRAMRAGPWHIFHFVGHGGFDRETDEGLVAVADDDGQAHYLTATLLGRLLADHVSLRLVLLNACEGARASARDIFSSTAAILVRRGIPAVLAMQYAITDDAAIEFSRAFYDAVADGLPLDAAVAEARKAISVAIANTLEWGTPVLFLRSPDGRIFDIERAATARPGDDQPPRAFAASREPLGRADDGQQRERLDATYTQALSAYYTADWERAVALLEDIVAEQAGYEDATAKLDDAHRQLQLAHHYRDGLSASEAQAWPTAIAELTAVVTIDPAYKDAAARLAEAQRRSKVAALVEEARQLHAARAWLAVVNVFDRIAALDAGYVDNEGLLETARAELAADEQERALAAHYRAGLQALDASDWRAAVRAFETIEQLHPGYHEARQLLERARHELVGSSVPRNTSTAPAASDRVTPPIVERPTAAPAATPVRPGRAARCAALTTVGSTLSWALLALINIASQGNIAALWLGGSFCIAVGGWALGLGLAAAAPGRPRREGLQLAAIWALAWAIGFPLVLRGGVAETVPQVPVWALGAVGTAAVLWRGCPRLLPWRIAGVSSTWLVILLAGAVVQTWVDRSLLPSSLSWTNRALASALIVGAVAGLLGGAATGLLLAGEPGAASDNQSSFPVALLPNLAAGGFLLGSLVGLLAAVLIWAPQSYPRWEWWALGWTVAGLATGLVLQRARAIPPRGATALVASGWGVGLALAAGVWVSLYHSKDTATWLSGWLVGMAVACVIGGGVMGLGVALDNTGRWRHVGSMVAGWTVAGLAGGVLLSWYPVWADDWWAAQPPLWYSGWLLIGLIVGAIGGSISVWQASQDDPR